MCGPRLALALRLSYASVGVLVGLAVFAAFLVTFHNPPAAYWGLLSAAYASLTLLLFLYLFALRPAAKPRPPSRAVLFFASLLAAVGIAAGVGGFVAYLGMGIINTLHGDDRPLFETEYIVCVWTFMTVKWSITSLYYSTRTYTPLHR